MTAEGEERLAGLMAAAQRGDAASYQRLLKECVPVIAAVARRQGVFPDQVDDVVQEVLITIHRARATYDPARPFLPWLRAIAQRRAIDGLRRHGRQSSREVHDPLAYENHPGGDEDATAGLDREEQAQALRAQIETLPPGQRQAAERLGLSGQTLEEAAAETGRSKTALKVNLHRALKALRARMGGAPRDGEGEDV
ncbi:MAG TPA: sigma-70 family RNA polymerase sigma factor [Acidisoma sp.]|jgi:RNA polymerase sigma factor (sigma-70 family)|uniref:sigma-70 family RNA polymerase sigma factor n=1 Tax=Acidisoma sp. TaxID=1872115 RepID=UPI002B8075B9|nr:sigma-70 family RNA polymerase sigma factor [Acidisoma sp.]HTI01977.1 sigma-70 family RNA polymerase sigma factor [Acidisoma sp.]